MKAKEKSEELDAINLQSIQYLILLWEIFSASNYVEKATGENEDLCLFHFFPQRFPFKLKILLNYLFSSKSHLSSNSLENSREFSTEKSVIFAYREFAMTVFNLQSSQRFTRGFYSNAAIKVDEILNFIFI